jgi:transcriptional regulator with XRE-family HTH domain
MKNLPKNIRFLRKQKGLSQESFADALGISRSRVGSYEESRALPSLETMVLISDFFKIPVDVLLRNNLIREGKVSFIELRNKRILFPISVDSDDSDLIEIVNAKAQAGYLSGYDDPEYIEQLQKIKLPFLTNGKYRAFPIKGDSMLPMKDGALVIGKYVEHRTDIKSDKTYVLVTLNDGIVYKRVTNNIDTDNSLRLVSDNKSYEPFQVDIDEILELWEFSCSLNTEEFSAYELKLSSISLALNDLGLEVKALERLIQ